MHIQGSICYTSARREGSVIHRVSPTAAWRAALRARLARNELAFRFGANFARQAIGGGLFFATTLLLSSCLGPAGYAAFFSNWNAANLIYVLGSFGLYAAIQRHILAGQSGRAVLRALWLPHAAQLVVTSLCCFVAASVGDYDPVLLVCVAGGMAGGNVFTAVALGLDRFRTFVAGELAQHALLLALVASVRPERPRDVGVLIVASVLFKCGIYIGGLRGSRAAAAPVERARSAPVEGYATYSYFESLLSAGTYRGFFMVISRLLTEQQVERIALGWSLCDRALLLVHGVSQVLYPKIIAGRVSPRARALTNAGTVAGFMLASLGLLVAFDLLRSFQGKQVQGTLASAGLLCVAFAVHVFRLQKLTEASALNRFRVIFTSHGVSIVAFAGMAAIGFATAPHGAGFAAALVGVVSLAGLPVFYLARPPARRLPDAVAIRS